VLIEKIKASLAGLNNVGLMHADNVLEQTHCVGMLKDPNCAKSSLFSPVPAMVRGDFFRKPNKE
jgi:hypothetical protein